MSQIISGGINCQKITKSRLKDGKFLNFVILMKDEPDQYGNNGMIVESVTKEEKAGGVKGAILGNVKIIGSATVPQVSQQTAQATDDLPF